MKFFVIEVTKDKYLGVGPNGHFIYDCKIKLEKSDFYNVDYVTEFSNSNMLIIPTEELAKEIASKLSAFTKWKCVKLVSVSPISIRFKEVKYNSAAVIFDQLASDEQYDLECDPKYSFYMYTPEDIDKEKANK